MCDYNLHSVKSRLAKVSDKLTTHDFGTGRRGFAASRHELCPQTPASFAVHHGEEVILGDSVQYKR